jgi:hypothetical protein
MKHLGFIKGMKLRGQLSDYQLFIPLLQRASKWLTFHLLVRHCVPRRGQVLSDFHIHREHSVALQHAFSLSLSLWSRYVNSALSRSSAIYSLFPTQINQESYELLLYSNLQLNLNYIYEEWQNFMLKSVGVKDGGDLYCRVFVVVKSQWYPKRGGVSG